MMQGTGFAPMTQPTMFKIQAPNNNSIIQND